MCYPAQAARTLSIALTLAAGLGVVALIVLQWQGPTLLRSMGASPELMGPGLEYLRIRALSGEATRRHPGHLLLT